MRCINCLVVILFLFLAQTAKSQDFHTDSATQLDRNGGIPGARSTEYYFKLSSRVLPSKIRFDSVWINNPSYSHNTVSFSEHNIKSNRAKGLTTWRINAGLLNDIMNKKPQRPTTPGAKGAAIIYYTYKGKHGTYIIKAFTHLHTINYP